jgi:hypothetical protein
MRIALGCLHLLAGLVALTLIAMSIVFLWPASADFVRPILYISMAVLIAMSIVRAVRKGRAHV